MSIRIKAVCVLVVLAVAGASAYIVMRNAPESPVDVGAPPEAPAPPVPKTPWPTYHGDAALTGRAEALGGDALEMRWRYHAGSPVLNTPVFDGERFFVATKRGEVIALSPKGEEQWRVRLMRDPLPGKGPDGEVLDSPLVCFVGRVVAACSGGKVYALDAVTGETLWKTAANASFLGSPNYVAGDPGHFILIDQTEGILLAFHPETGEILWQSEAIDRCDGSPSVGTDFTAFGSCAAALHVFDHESGVMVRQIAVEGDSQIAGGVAFDGDELFSGCRSGKIVRVNARTGETVWVNSDSDYEVFATPALDGEWVVAGSEDGKFYGIDRNTGATRWTFDTGGDPMSPVIAGTRVLGAADGTLYMLDLTEGRLLWSHEVSDEITGPAVAAGLAVVGSRDGTVSAWGPAGG